ncbi:Trk system potassium uptake protein TrkA [Acaryochloris thomasi RCC1774]|uniref:Trk system potassium uptake protein TrkA n=1 Tax=Acaryochloris thomasi RCC1774 TaxID=1764569 RepID=A0A2W1J9X2_9CYAN|nr:TrkA family potassium uptake protein [Acaryochloris thomasi]PZD70980.1 Trk system potassium uptake protein TrkA [Acaryochloris thomasi RCC1774]
MYLIIVGGGPEGASLVDLALKEGHQVVLIESDEKRARAVLQQHDVTVLNADIADDQILDEAGAAQADALIATTNDDSANLMAMVLGKEHNIETLVTTVSQPHHQSMFERLGAQVLAKPERLIAQHLYHLTQRQDESDR